MHASLAGARTKTDTFAAIRGTETKTSCLIVIKSGKVKSDGDLQALLSGRSMRIVMIKVLAKVCVTGAGMH